MSVPFASEHRDENCHGPCCGGPYDGCGCEQCRVEPEEPWTNEQRQRYAKAMSSWHEKHRTKPENDEGPGCEAEAQSVNHNPSTSHR